MLVVVEDGDVEFFAQTGLDLEAARRRDVLKVHAAVHRGHGLDDADDFFGVLGVQAHGPGVHVSESLEESGLALHHGQCGGGTNIAQAEHGGAIGDHCNGIALDGQTARIFRVLGNGHAHAGHAGSVGAGEIIAVTQ